MALTDKLTAIADGFRTSRGTEQKYTLDEMAVLAAEKVGGGAGIAIIFNGAALDEIYAGTYTIVEGGISNGMEMLCE